jgi:hypothetical protein
MVVRSVISIAIGLHFFAIFTTVVGSGNMRFPAPPLVENLRYQTAVNCYLESTFLTNPYRFYAPDPGPTNLMYFRLQYRDKVIRWVEMARREEFLMRIPYQRYMSLTMLLGGLGIVPDPTDRQLALLSPEAQVCIPSYARHIVLHHSRYDAKGDPIPVDYVGVYYVDHYILQPWHIRANWQADDVRMYIATFLGDYAPNGERVDSARPKAVRFPNVEHLLAKTLITDAVPLVKGVPAEKRLEAIASLDLPKPWLRLLTQCPDLLDNLPDVDPNVDRVTEQQTLFALRGRVEAKVASLTRTLMETDEWDRPFKIDKPGEDVPKERGAPLP